MDRTAAEGRISTNRANAIHRRTLPALVIHTREDPVDPPHRAESPRAYVRLCRVQIEGFVEETQNSGPNDDQADDLADQVERILLPNLLLPRLTGPEDSPVTLDKGRTTYEGVSFEQEDGGIALLGAFFSTWAFAYVQEVDGLDAEGERARLGAFQRLGVRYEIAPPALVGDDITLPGP